MASDGSQPRRLENPNRTDSVSWSKDGKKLTFVCAIDGKVGGICTMNIDGSDLRQTTFSIGSSPFWSPDGQYIVYYRGDPYCFLCNLSGQLWIMKADGSYHQRLTKGPVDRNPVWRPQK